jgi:hypothetical protein
MRNLATSCQAFFGFSFPCEGLAIWVPRPVPSGRGMDGHGQAWTGMDEHGQTDEGVWYFTRPSRLFVFLPCRLAAFAELSEVPDLRGRRGVLGGASQFCEGARAPYAPFVSLRAKRSNPHCPRDPRLLRFARNDTARVFQPAAPRLQPDQWRTRMSALRKTLRKSEMRPVPGLRVEIC